MTQYQLLATCIVFFLTKGQKPITNIISWQDERALDEYRDGLSFVDFINKNYKELFSPYQNVVSPGYVVTTLFHILKSDKTGINKHFSNCSLHFAPDFIVQELLKNNLSHYKMNKHVTDHSLAHSSGLYNIKTKNWNYSLIEALGYDKVKFPEILESGSFVGYAGKNIKPLQGVPVFLGMGDNQSSVYGVMMEQIKKGKFNYNNMSNSIVLSIGTSGQVSAIVNNLKTESKFLDYRPFLNNSFLLVGASLSSGKTMETVKDFIKDAAATICKKKINDQKAYDIIENSILSESTLKFKTTLNGTRYSPNVRGSIKNIDLNNFSLDNLITSAAYGIVEELYKYYKKMNISSDNILGVGNGLLKNKYLLDIIKKVFKKEVFISEIKEAASFGAAMSALEGRKKI